MKGVKFCVTGSGNSFDFKGETRKFTRKLMLQEIFFDKTYNNDSLVRKPSKKYISTFNNELKDLINILHKIEPVRTQSETNLTEEEMIAYKELKDMAKTEIEIKKADKSDTWVIMDKETYKNLILEEHLKSRTYEKANLNANAKVFSKLGKLTAKHSNALTKDEIKYINDAEWENAYFYGLPKIHKCEEITSKIRENQTDYLKMDFPINLKTRPICGGPRAVTQGASCLLSKVLTPLVTEMKSYIKDEWDFVRKFPKKIDYDANLLSCDIKSLYPSIPIDLGLQALEYWLDRFMDKIPPRFTKACILELAEFVLSNNYFIFDEEMYHQIIGTSMGTIFAPPYSCLTVGYLEETKLYPVILPSKFSNTICERIIEHFYRFMDDGTTLLPAEIEHELFLQLLNSMHPAIQYTIEKPELIRDKEMEGKSVQKLVFLALILHLNEQGDIWTNVFYKETNTHEYLNFDSSHPDHVKNNIPYVLAKRIVVFTSRGDEMETNLEDLRQWLRKCGYPDRVIEKGIHDALLQGPANIKTDDKIIPLISKYVGNYDNQLVLQITREILKNAKDQRLQRAFENVKLIHAYEQPPNLLHSLSSSKFSSREVDKKVGIWKCTCKRCKICNLYLQEGTSVIMADNSTWEVKCYGSCNSLNVLYYLICMFCDESYIGKTCEMRSRTNNHITGCGGGKSSSNFDNHVFNCAKSKGMDLIEPYFKAHILMVCNNYYKLLAHESALHAKGLDTMNRP